MSDTFFSILEWLFLRILFSLLTTNIDFTTRCCVFYRNFVEQKNNFANLVTTCLSVTNTVLIGIQFSGFNKNLGGFLGIIQVLDTLGVQDLVAVVLLLKRGESREMLIFEYKQNKYKNKIKLT